MTTKASGRDECSGAFLDKLRTVELTSHSTKNPQEVVFGRRENPHDGQGTFKAKNYVI
jgi:hypothetical protein